MSVSPFFIPSREEENMIKILLLITFIPFFLFFNMASGKIGGGDIVFKIDGARDAIFSHDSHVSEIGLKCTECHDRIFTTKEKHRRVTMEEMKRGASCGACHNGKRAFDVRANCSNCHKKN